jgi:hypothetical protein
MQIELAVIERAHAEVGACDSNEPVTTKGARDRELPYGHAMSMYVAHANEVGEFPQIARTGRGVVVERQEGLELPIRPYKVTGLVEERHGVGERSEHGLDVTGAQDHACGPGGSTDGLLALDLPEGMDVPGHGRLLYLYAASEDA